MQTLLVGDIHGCYQEFQALLDHAGLANGDLILSLGDAVDRGPETPQVVKFFRTQLNARVLMGNHERKHVRARHGEVKLAISQQISRVQLGESYASTLDWMASLPLYVELSEAVAVHGYLEPGLAMEKQNPMVLCGTMGGDQILKRRYDRPWYELYDGSLPVVVGHLNYSGTDQPFIYKDHVYGLDTDCVTGGALTGLLLPSFRILSVPGRGNLWRRVRDGYRRPARPVRQIPASAWTEAEDRVLEKLFERVLDASQKILMRLQAQSDYATLSPRQQARLFAAEVGEGSLARLLHLARSGKLELDLARKAVGDPTNLEGLSMELDRQAGK